MIGKGIVRVLIEDHFPGRGREKPAEHLGRLGTGGRVHIEGSVILGNYEIVIVSQICFTYVCDACRVLEPGASESPVTVEHGRLVPVAVEDVHMAVKDLHATYRGPVVR